MEIVATPKANSSCHAETKTPKLILTPRAKKVEKDKAATTYHP